MSSSSHSTHTIQLPDSVSIHNVNMSNVTKLTATNYLMWNCQVLALMDGYDLSGYLDGSNEAPSPTITADGDTAANPAYTAWKRQDRLIYSALLGAISIGVQPILSTTNTSAEIWSTLASTYAKPSRAHVKQLKQQLEQWKKGAKPIDEYVQGFTTRSDRLALLGKPIEHEDQIDFIIGGLPEEYKHLADQIEARDAPPSITEIHEKLINYELKLQVQPPATVVPITANAAYSRNTNNRNQTRFLPKTNQPWQQTDRPSLASCETGLEIPCRHNISWDFSECYYTSYGSCIIRCGLGRGC